MFTFASLLTRDNSQTTDKVPLKKSACAFGVHSCQSNRSFAQSLPGLQKLPVE